MASGVTESRRNNSQDFTLLFKFFPQKYVFRFFWPLGEIRCSLLKWLKLASSMKSAVLNVRLHIYSHISVIFVMSET